MKIKKVFDVQGPYGFVPNGWNYKYTNDMWDYNFIVTHETIAAFNKNYEHLSVYDCNLNISTYNIENKHISELQYNPSDSKVYQNGESGLVVYTIHPFGSIDTCLGNNLNYHQNTHCFDFISEQSKEYIRKASNYYLIFDYSSEGDIKPELFETLHSKCIELNIPPKKVLVITSSMNTRDLYDMYLKNNPTTEQFYTAYYCWPILPKSGETRDIIQNRDVIEFNGNSNVNSLMSSDEFKNATNRNKKALIFNRRVASHRVILLSLLHNDNLIDNVDYSIDLSLSVIKNLGLNLTHDTGHNGEPYLKNDKVKSSMVNGFFKLNKIKKKTIDYEDIDGVWGFGFENKTNYLNTYFSVITETIFYEYGNYISEKSFKGFAHLHPFVIVGKPGILKYLKSKGFKTFSDFWDESYDEIEDNSDRMESVYKTIKSLIEKTTEEWDELNTKLLPILEHNRNTLITIKETEVNTTYINNLYKLFNDEPNTENFYLF